MGGHEKPMFVIGTDTHSNVIYMGMGDDHVTGGGDRKKFREPFDHCQYNGFEVAHVYFLLGSRRMANISRTNPLNTTMGPSVRPKNPKP